MIKNILATLAPSLIVAIIIVLPMRLAVWIAYKQIDKEIAKKKHK